MGTLRIKYDTNLNQFENQNNWQLYAKKLLLESNVHTDVSSLSVLKCFFEIKVKAHTSLGSLCTLLVV